jgi:Uma2 family endonuclease
MIPMLPATTAAWAEPVPRTADDLRACPDDGWRYELVQGRLVRMPPSGWDHANITGGLYVAIYQFVSAVGIGRAVPGETGFDISHTDDEGTTIIAPDIAFVRADRAPAPGSSEFPRLAPDLVVEVASSSQYRPGMYEKACLWLAAGVQLLWMVWPTRREVDVWFQGDAVPRTTLVEGDLLDGGTVLPGFHYRVADLFK